MPQNKDCTTCKWEPDWVEEFKGCGWFYGNCKRIPVFLQEGAFRKNSDNLVNYEIGSRSANFF